LFCAERYTTFERIERKRLWILKKNGNKEPFKPDKVLEGIALSCRKRPIDAARMDVMVREVELRLFALGTPEVSSELVGGAVMEVLREVDDVAYLRFASVYREFESVEQFVETIRPMTKDGAK